MIRKLYIMLLASIVILSCKKDGNGDNGGGIYIVTAPKMISITKNDWSVSEPGLKNKTGYQYTKSPDNLSTTIKAEVHVSAVDDVNRAAKGSILLNIAPDNHVFFAGLDMESQAKADAYVMMLNYNNKTLETITGISSSIGGYVENGIGGNSTVDAILAKVTNLQDADQLSVTYTASQGEFTMAVFKQNDGRYVFNYRGSR